MKKDIVILGESHTRSYNHIQDIYPFFLSSGRSINLDDLHIGNTIEQILKVRNKIGSDCTYITKLGEPNVRYQINEDWHIHKDTGFKYQGKVNYSYLDRCIENYVNMVNQLGFIDFVISPTTAFTYSFDGMQYFNYRLKQAFGNRLIDIYQYTIQDGKVKDEYKAKDYSYDPVHLNSKVSDLFLKELTKKDKIYKLEYYKKLTGEFENKDIANGAVLGAKLPKNRFGTFTVND